MKKLKKTVLILLIITPLLAVSAESGEIIAETPLQAIPGGMTVGLKLYTDGLLVVGFSDIPADGRSVSPGKEAGLQKGDKIIRINNEKVSDIRSFSKGVRESRGEKILLTVERSGKIYDKTITPIYYNDVGQYKLGIWVRDSAAGIGTVTFMLPDGSFAALGHGVSDPDTQTILSLSDGEVTGSHISSIVKGQSGVPGELRGVFDNSMEGRVLINCESGVYGVLSEHTQSEPAMEIEHEDDVTEGNATILANINGDSVEEFEVEIHKIMRFNNGDGKCMVIKVTDKRLLERTGGIVQGMSGSPILKDGKIVGAVTHVFLNDPTRGYAIFAERMLKTLEKGKK